MGQGHVRWHNEERYHESPQNLTPADVYHGLARELTTCRLVFGKSCPIGLTTHRLNFIVGNERNCSLVEVTSSH